MTQLGDYQIKTPSPATGEGLPKERIAIAVVAVLVLAIGGYWFFGGDEAPPPVETVADTPPPAVSTPPPAPPPPEPDPEPDPEIPALDASDDFVRALVAELSSHPALASWLVSEGMVRRFVSVVDSVANGENPSQQISFMRPSRRFSTTGSPEALFVDPQSYGRYDEHAQIIDSLDRQGAAELYERLEPLMNEAYVELGYPDLPFRQTLQRAVTHLLETPIVKEPPPVMPYAPFYRYRDQDLEDLSQVQKQFLLMGPDNVRAVQAAIRSFAEATGLRVR